MKAIESQLKEFASWHTFVPAGEKTVKPVAQWMRDGELIFARVEHPELQRVSVQIKSNENRIYAVWAHASHELRNVLELKKPF